MRMVVVMMDVEKGGAELIQTVSLRVSMVKTVVVVPTSPPATSISFATWRGSAPCVMFQFYLPN